MVDERIWIGEVAESLGVSQSTVRAWCDRMEFQSKDSKGRRMISPDQFRALQAVQALLNDGHTFNTVQRRLRDPAEEAQRDRSARVDGSQNPHSEPAALIEAVVSAIAHQTDLAEKYARAAHEIGKLEERTETLTLQLQESRSALAEAQQRLTAANDETEVNAKLKEVIEARDRQIASLENENAQLKTRRWWQRPLF